jgi:hypothetical protein
VEIIRHSNTCTLKMGNKTIDAVVDQFIFEAFLDVIVQKEIKLKLKWNGRQYEGRSAGMDIHSNGPAINKTKTGIRG